MQNWFDSCVSLALHASHILLCLEYCFAGRWTQRWILKMTLDKIVSKIVYPRPITSILMPSRQKKIVCGVLSRGWTMTRKNATRISITLIFLVDRHDRSRPISTITAGRDFKSDKNTRSQILHFSLQRYTCANDAAAQDNICIIIAVITSEKETDATRFSLKFFALLRRIYFVKGKIFSSSRLNVFLIGGSVIWFSFIITSPTHCVPGRTYNS